jgi:hypothetical protein
VEGELDNPPRDGDALNFMAAPPGGGPWEPIPDLSKDALQIRWIEQEE